MTRPPKRSSKRPPNGPLKGIGAAACVLGLTLASPQGIAAADSSDGADPASGPGRSERASAARDQSPSAAVRGRAAAPTRKNTAPPQTAAVRKNPSASGLSPVAVRRSPTIGIDESAETAVTPVLSAPQTIPAAAASATPPAARARTPRPETAAPATHAVAGLAVRLAQFLDAVTTMLPGTPANPVGEFLAGALLLVRRTLLPGIPTIPVVSVGNTAVAEGTAGDPQTAVFTVTLGHAYADRVQLDYATADGTATAGADYAPVSGVLVFDPGQTSATVSVPVIAEALFEPDETFTLTVSPGAAPGWLGGVVLAAARATVTEAPGSAMPITFPELDNAASALAVRVDRSQANADGIKVDAGTTFTLTLPGPVASYTVLANKPALVDIAGAGNQLTVNAKTPGFLGLSVTSQDGTAARYVGLYIADPVTHLVPDTVTGYLPVGTVTSPDAKGDAFLQDFNFRQGVAPIDYLYIYDQGGADYTDGNLRGLLTQAVRHGLVPVVVFYNIQAVDNATGKTNIVEGWNAAYQAINDYNWKDSGQRDPNMFTGYMKRYFTKLAADFTTMNQVGVPVQVVVEPDFLGYMKANTPAFQTSTFVPQDGDRTLNTAKVSSMYDAGLLTRGVDPAFPDTVAGLVQAINYYTGAKMPNLRLGWKTNIWSVANQQNWSLGVLHMTDPVRYPWQGEWTGPAKDFKAGRTYIADQATGLGTFLKRVGVTSWSGSPARTPFLAIDKYGVDGAYMYDPQLLGDSQTAAFGNLSTFIAGCWDADRGQVRADITDAQTQLYFGLTRAEFATFYTKYNGTYPKTAADVRAVFTTLQNAAKADPNMALWFLNADQWSNYLLMVESLSTELDGTKVMLWQIPQGHVNGSTTLTGRDLDNSIAKFEDSAASYFFGDTFTATGGRLTHFSADKAEDPNVSVSGNTITWGEHMTAAADAGAMSVLFGAGLGISTRGSVTPAGGITDMNFWADKATAYLSGVGR